MIGQFDQVKAIERRSILRTFGDCPLSWYDWDLNEESTRSLRGLTLICMSPRYGGGKAGAGASILELGE